MQSHSYNDRSFAAISLLCTSNGQGLIVASIDLPFIIFLQTVILASS